MVGHPIHSSIREEVVTWKLCIVPSRNPRMLLPVDCNSSTALPHHVHHCSSTDHPFLIRYDRHRRVVVVVDSAAILVVTTIIAIPNPRDDPLHRRTLDMVDITMTTNTMIKAMMLYPTRHLPTLVNCYPK